MNRSNLVVYSALGANLGIAAIKFAAGAWTGSSAMISEAIHSTVDSGNQLLLLYGQRRALRPADPQHPFGHGMEIFFWAFVVALLLFSFGGALSIYEGFRKLTEGQPLQNPLWNFAVLGVAMIFEGASLLLARREIRKSYPGLPVWEAVRASKNPSVFVVVMEDTAALIGLLIAAVGLGGALAFHMPGLDGAASIAIGLLLIGTAGVLARETRSLLTGESARARDLREVRAVVDGDKAVEKLTELRSMQLGADDILVAVTIELRDDLPPLERIEALERLTKRLEQRLPAVRRVFIRLTGQHTAQVQSGNG